MLLSHCTQHRIKYLINIYFSEITCPEPTLPDIDDDKNKKYPLSWIRAPVPHVSHIITLFELHTGNKIGLSGRSVLKNDSKNLKPIKSGTQLFLTELNSVIVT